MGRIIEGDSPSARELPISSLIAWVEYLRTKEIDPSLLGEMEKDVKRLEMIAERFSKIGSNPDPTPVNISNSIRTALNYMETRISAKVKIYTHLPDNPVLVLMNDSLFAWVIENLTKMLWMLWKARVK